jgi:hypothetical protein
MSDPNDLAGVAQPQAVVGPITLGQKQGGTTITMQPNSSIDAATLRDVLGTSTVSLTSATSSASGVAIAVVCNGATQTIAISGESVARPATTFAPGTSLTAIERKGSELVLHTAGGGDKDRVTFPIGSGTVTATFPSALAT